MVPKTLHTARRKTVSTILTAFGCSLAVLVIFSHSFLIRAGYNSDPFIRFSRGQTTGGDIAVNLFFIMSGYLISASYLRSAGILDYLGKRVRRIYPGFIASMLFGALVILPLSGGVLNGGTPVGRLVNFAEHTLYLRQFRYSGALLQSPVPVVNLSIPTIPF